MATDGRGLRQPVARYRRVGLGRAFMCGARDLPARGPWHPAGALSLNAHVGTEPVARSGTDICRAAADGTQRNLGPMTGIEFRCSSCEQVIEVDVAMREAIRGAGCPVCGSVARAADFVTR